MRLSMEHLSKHFRNKIAVDQVNLNLEEGVYGFLGANGAGKTTLMQMLCGILMPTSGEVKLDGKNNMSMGEEFRDILGYLPQEFGYTPGFTGKDFLLYIAAIKGLEPEYAKRRISDLLELVNLSDNANRKIKTYSGGMKRRLGIAQALLNDPRVLILDEPTSGLDPKERAYFRNMISDLSRDKIVILSTHIVSDVEYIADKILIMKKGNFILNGNTEELNKEVEGKVWECSIPRELWSDFRRDKCIVNSHYYKDMVETRFVYDKELIEGARPVKPVLEDLYLHCFYDEIDQQRGELVI